MRRAENTFTAKCQSWPDHGFTMKIWNNSLQLKHQFAHFVLFNLLCVFCTGKMKLHAELQHGNFVATLFEWNTFFTYFSNHVRHLIPITAIESNNDTTHFSHSFKHQEMINKFNHNKLRRAFPLLLTQELHESKNCNKPMMVTSTSPAWLKGVERYNIHSEKGVNTHPLAHWTWWAR